MTSPGLTTKGLLSSLKYGTSESGEHYIDPLSRMTCCAETHVLVVIVEQLLFLVLQDEEELLPLPRNRRFLPVRERTRQQLRTNQNKPRTENTLNNKEIVAIHSLNNKDSYIP